MKTHALALGVAAAALLALGACNKTRQTGTNGAAERADPEGAKAAGTKTIAAGLAAGQPVHGRGQGRRLDQTLAGPGPYTVFVPDDAAFAQAPAGTFDAKPENRAQLTGVLTNLILPGTVMAADIDKAIDSGKGKARARDHGRRHAHRHQGRRQDRPDRRRRATRRRSRRRDEQFTNGVVHHIDAVLMPSKARRNGAGGRSEGRRLAATSCVRAVRPQMKLCASSHFRAQNGSL